MRNRSNHPVAPDQLPLAQLVLRRRREMVLSQGEVARLMHKAAEQAGASYCLATRQAVSEYEHGRIPYPHTLRLLASALGVSLEEAQGAADRQRAHARLPGLPARSWGTLRIPGGLRIPPPRGPVEVGWLGELEWVGREWRRRCRYFDRVHERRCLDADRGR